ncbi:MAG: hypothetical protein C5B52_00790 [Bacteroidetes bacterium]|nr:MAG: hypothetical protein C5B52_00790 [Bacteroidota bacterium]
MESPGKIYLESLIKRFLTYKELGDKTFAQLEDNDFHFTPGPESNSIAAIVQHISGNMLSRWTNFLTEDGEKEWRNRDQEFEETAETKAEIVARWEKGWKCLLDTLKSLTEADLLKTIYIRNEPLIVIDAINRQFAHYPYHVGQIIYVGKMIRKENWNSLSIPKGKSEEYNKMIDAGIAERKK